MRRRVLTAAAAVALAVAAPAAAQSGSSFESGTGVIIGLGSPTAKIVAQAGAHATVTGELVVAFEGDPSTCTAAGRCDTTGTITWRPSRSHRLYLSDIVDRSKRRVMATMFGDDALDEGAQVFSRARRARAGGGTALCTDVRRAPAGLDAVVAGRQLAIGVSPASEGPLESRCGGPVWADLRYVLPRPRFDLADVRRRGAAVDLRTEQTFVAGGLRGTVRSTLRMRIARLRRIRDEQSDVDRERGPRLRLQAWRVASMRGSVRVDVRGSDDAVRCRPLDACGLTGTVTLSPRPRDGELVVLDLERPIDGERFAGSGGWYDDGTATATFTRADAPAPCNDAVPLTAGGVFVAEKGGQVTLTYDAFPRVRSRCPGPALELESMAAGVVPLRAFRRSRRVVVRLTRGSSRTVDGYRMTTTPDLTLELVRR